VTFAAISKQEEYREAYKKIRVFQEREHSDAPSEPERIRLIRYQGIVTFVGNRGHSLSVLDRKEGMGFLHQTSAVTV
jgi:hypothetical protein